MYLIGNTCFQTKIGYHKKIHLLQASLKNDYCRPQLNQRFLKSICRIT